MAISKKSLITKISRHWSELQKFLPVNHPLLGKSADLLNQLPLQVLRSIYSRVKSLNYKTSQAFRAAVNDNTPALQNFLQLTNNFQKKLSVFAESESRQEENPDAILNSLN